MDAKLYRILKDLVKFNRELLECLDLKGPHEFSDRIELTNKLDQIEEDIRES